MRLKMAALTAVAMLCTGTAQAAGGGMSDGFENQPATRWTGTTSGSASYGFYNGRAYSGQMSAWMSSKDNGKAMLTRTVDVSTWQGRDSCQASVYVDPQGWTDNLVTIGLVDAANGRQVLSDGGYFHGSGYQPLWSTFELPAETRTVKVHIGYVHPQLAQPTHSVHLDQLTLVCGVKPPGPLD